MKTFLRSFMPLASAVLALTGQQAVAQGSGGTVTSSGAYAVHTFTSSGTFTLNSARTVEIFLLGGGGGGGNDWGGGGGAGGRVNTSFTLPAGTYSVVVGAGGAIQTALTAGNDGGATTFNGYIAYGGGGGGRVDGVSGRPGGNGGGGGGSWQSMTSSGGTASQGYPGGAGYANTLSSGGGGLGGAGRAGVSRFQAGNGGAPITYYGVQYGGGGGGGGDTGTQGFGGGAGAGNGSVAQFGTGGSASPNTGSGGGGGGSHGGPGGAGGSGIFIIRYIANSAPTVSSSATSIYCGQGSTVTWNAADGDGNFSYVNVYVTQNGSPYWDHIGTYYSASGSASWSSSANFNSANTGSYIFVSRAVDAAGAYTDSYAYFDVYNRAPTGSLSLSRSSANVGESVTITVSASDPDGNLDFLNLWVATPNHGWRHILSDNSVITGGNWERSRNAAPSYGWSGTLTRTFQFSLDQGFGNYRFQLGTYDRYGATHATDSYATQVTVSNRIPFLPSMSASPAIIEFGQSSTITSTATDPDSNLYFHGIIVLNAAGNEWDRGAMTDHATGWGNHPVTPHVTSASYSSGSASGASSTKWIVHRPWRAGSMTYHANTNDGSLWASSETANWNASAGYVGVTVNKATPNGTFADRSFSTTRTLTAADLNATFANPHSSAVASPTGAISYNYPVGSVLTPGTYTVTATYPGDSNYNGATKSATFTIANSAPTITASVTPSSIFFGQTVSVSFTGSDVDGNLYANAILTDPNAGGYSRPAGLDYTRIGWNGYAQESGTWTNLSFSNDNASGSTNTKTGTYRPKVASPSYLFTTYASDNIVATGAWTYVAVNKATPTGTYSVGGSRAVQSGLNYVVQSGDLISSFVNPFSSLVAAPTGSITYTISPTSASGTPGSAVTPGVTIFNAGLTYTVRATYSGDSNYNSSSVDATFIVNKVPQAALSMSASPTSVAYGNTSTLSATGGSGAGAVTYTCTAGGSIVGNIFTATAGSGTVTITATKASDANYDATTATATVTLSKGTQSSVTVIGSVSSTYGKTYTGSATGGNGTGAYVWSLGIGSTASNAAINSATGVITADSVGTVVVNAYRAADPNYNQSNISADFTVSFGARVITVTLAGSKPYDLSTAPTGVSASITSGSLAAGDSISYMFVNTSSAAVGSYTDLATAAVANSSNPTDRTPSYSINYAGSYNIGQSSQAITFDALPSKMFGDEPFTVSATADSGLPVSFTIASGPATIAGSTVTITGAGTVTVRASQAGNASYSAALNVDRSFTVVQGPQVVTINPSVQTVYTTQTVLFTASGGQNGYNWGGTAGASGSGATKSVAFNSNGSYTVTIQSPAGGNFAASNVATATIQVNPAFILTLSADPGGTVTGAGLYPSGVNATPGAVANAGYVFAGWYGSDAVSMVNPYDPNGLILMSSNKSLTARFVLTDGAPTLGTIDFGPASIPAGIGTHSAIRDAIMANTGNSALELRRLAIVSGNDDFSAPAAGGMIAGGSNLSTPVTFKPTGSAIGVRTGRVVIVTTDAIQPLIAYDLTGTASTGAEPPIVTLSLTSLATIFPDDDIALNVYTEVNFGNVSFFTWRIVTPSGATAPQSISGPSPTLSGSIPFTPTELGSYQFQVTATNDSGQSTSEVLDFVVVQGLFTRILNARAEPTGSLDIWFRPSTTSSKAVDVWKGR